MSSSFPLLSALILLAAGACAHAQVVINEIHYSPVEKARFDASGNPVFGDTNAPADLSDDVHEFVELRNTGAVAANIGGWKLSGGIDFTIPAGTTVEPNGFVVIAKAPGRIAEVYALAAGSMLGPYAGLLGNSGETIRLKDTTEATVDSVTYESGFPWPISANRLGANDDFTGLDSQSYQYKGRSLQRVSATASANDPANWVAVRSAAGPTTFADLPTPGASNIVARAVPKPVVLGYTVAQATDNAPLIRAGVPVKMTCNFSSTNSLTNVQAEYFIDNVSAWGEARTTVPMTALGSGQFSVTLPGQADRSIVRIRIKADRGDGQIEVVWPRVDDPIVVPTGYSGGVVAREPWHAYFVTPVRTSVKPIYDCFVSTDGQALSDTQGQNPFPFTGLNGLQTMAFNATGNLRRVLGTGTVTTTYPREPGQPGVNVTDPVNGRIWNGAVPAVFVENGIVRDVQLRFHGSRYNRRPGRKSYKMNFLDYQAYQGTDSIFITDKDNHFATGHGLHQLAGLPISGVRYVDWYFNNDGVQARLEQGEYNGDLLDLYHEKMQRLSPGSQKEATGEYYKSAGVLVGLSYSPGQGSLSGEGPWGSGNGWRLPATTGTPSWSELQRYEYTYTLQNHAWKGAKPIRDLITGMWAARGDNESAQNPNVANTKAWLQQNWDVETELTSLALGNWMTPWDDTTQNHFLWRRIVGYNPDGTAIQRWARMLWDFDGMYGTREGLTPSASIYLGEVGNPNNNFRGPNYIKDSFIKAYRTEFKQRMWVLNNTLLDPENLQTLTFFSSTGVATTYRAFIDSLNTGLPFTQNRFNSVNSQVALGVYYKPRRPSHVAPSNGGAVLPGASLTASAYIRDAAFTHAAPPATVVHGSSKWEIRAVNGSYDTPLYLLTSTTSLTSLPIPFNQLTFGQTYYWRVTYYDADGHPSITSAESSFSYGPTSTVAGNVSLNELMAENKSAVANGAGFPDYLELKNNTGTPIDLGGWSLTDNELEPLKFVFPGGTSIPANGYLVVWCDSDSTAPGVHAGFKLDNDGQRVLLVQGSTVRDVVAFGPQAANLSVGRIVNGTGGWTLTNPTPGLANTAVTALGAATSLKVNEWMANPAAGDDWFELYNSSDNPVALSGLYLSDAAGTGATNTKIPPLSFIAGRGYTEFTADDSTQGFAHCNFKLSNGGDSIYLTDLNGTTTLDVAIFGAQASGVSQGRLVDGSATIVSFPQSASPGARNHLLAAVVINEALTNSTTPFEDAIEIYNPTANDVDIGHWWLSDDADLPKKYQLPANTIVRAGDYRVFYENHFNSSPGSGNSFSLSSFGDEIVLSSADAAGVLTGLRARVSFGAALENVSFGRIVTAGGRNEFWPLIARTFGQDSPANVGQFRLGAGGGNPNPRVGPIIINELMYHPMDVGGADNARDEFIELHNVTTGSVGIAGWRLKGDSDFTFPAGGVILPGDYVLVVGFDPADADALAAFRAVYGLDPAVAIFGPFTPKLANGAQTVELGYPGVPELGVTPSILMDKVAYEDRAPWSTQPDGNGPSLQRISRTNIGNDAGNWGGAAATPGAVNTGQVPISDSDGDGMIDVWEITHRFNPRSAADAMADADTDGQNNRGEFYAGTDPNNNTDSFKADVVTSTGGGFKVRFHAKADKSYTVQYRTNLVAGTWVTLVHVPAQATSSDAEVTDPTPDSQRFYRVVTPSQP